MTLIVVHSPKGGVGSTFIAAQLAIRMAQQGHDVAAIDCTDQEALKLHFGLRPVQPLIDIDDAQQDTLVVSGVTLMNGRSLALGSPAGDDLAGIAATLFPAERTTILDVAAGDCALKERLMPFATLHVCVLLPTPAAVSVLPRIGTGAATVDLPKTVFVLNQLDDRLRLSRHTHQFMRGVFRDRLIGTVRRDEAVNEALAMFEPISRFAPTSVVIADLADLTTAIEHQCGLVAPEPVVAGGVA